MQTLSHAQKHTEREIASLESRTLLHIYRSLTLNTLRELAEVLLSLIWCHFPLTQLPQLEMSYFWEIPIDDRQSPCLDLLHPAALMTSEVWAEKASYN